VDDPVPEDGDPLWVVHGESSHIRRLLRTVNRQSTTRRPLRVVGQFEDHDVDEDLPANLVGACLDDIDGPIMFDDNFVPRLLICGIALLMYIATGCYFASKMQ
jgi:hypothetical protein